MKVSDALEFEVPTWAAYYLTYGEDETLSERDLKLANSFTGLLNDIKQAEGWKDFILDFTGEVNEFNAFPEFGLPCQTEICKVVFTK